MMTKWLKSARYGKVTCAALVASASILFGIPAMAVDLLHNSQDTGSTKWQAQGGWGITGGKYGKFTCATCHEPDSDNNKNIRRIINTMDGSNWPNGTPANTVYFLNQTSMGDDSVRRTSSARICEVCHSQNRFHNYSTTSNLTHGGSLGHPAPKQVCTNCHKHNTGFKAACGGCHGNPPSTASIGGDYGLVGTPRPSNAMQPGQVGAHVTHVQTRSMVCDTCHYISNGSVKMPNQSGSIQIGFFGFGGKITSGTYTPYTSATRGFPFRSGTALTTIAPAQTTYANANKCSNVYCHGGGSAPDGKAPLTGGVNQTPRWDATGQNACGNCHGTTAGSPPTMGSHVKHAGATGGYSYICDTCHPDNTDNSHVQGNVRWSFNSLNNDPRVASATYQAAGKPTAEHVGSTGGLAPSSSYGQCFNVVCHSDGKGGSARVTPTWGGTLPTDCSGCHYGTSGGNQIVSGSHDAHVNSARASYTCEKCHALTVDTAGNNTINPTTGATYHANGATDVKYTSFNASAVYAGPACTNIYCHSSGTAASAPFRMMSTPKWGAALPSNCTACHGGAGTTSGRFRVMSTGRHQKHMRGTNFAAANTYYSYSCSDCHNTTVSGNSTIINRANHANYQIDVAFAPSIGGTYASTGHAPGVDTTRTCANIYCHSNAQVGGQAGTALVYRNLTGSKTWYGTAGSLGCTGCHGYTTNANTLSGKHGVHVSATINPAIGTGISCNECHGKTRTTAGWNDRNKHNNRFIDYSGVKAGGQGNLVTATGVCFTVYCHSNGKGTFKSMSSANWFASRTLDCSGCHGSDASAAFISVAGEPNYTNAGAGLARANSHQKHVGVTGAATCVSCHSATVTADGTGIATGTLVHTDRTIDVVQGGGKSFTWTSADKSCASISCHGAGSATAVWGATMPVDCTGCHGGNTTAATQISTGKHPAHVNNTGVLGDNLGCVECHAKTVSGDRSISNTNNHGNTFADYSGTKAGKSTTYSAGVCSATYCHTDGKGTAKDMTSAAWGSAATIGCTGCHGSDPAPDFTSQAGEPNYANGGAGVLLANSHKTHAAAGASTCDTCHTATVTSDGLALRSGNLHLNRAVDVSFNTAKANATWNGGLRTCSNITCHGGGTATWGDPASAGCRACHGTLSAGHAIHIGDLISNNMVAMYNFTSNRSTGTIYRFGCANCHPTDPAKHRNGTVDLTLNKNKSGASGLTQLNSLNTSDTAGWTKTSGTQLTCETVYCHSNGRTSNLAVGDYRQTPNWFGGTFGPNRCGSCHDNPPQYAGQSHYVSASSIGNNGTPPYRETGHMVGIHFMNTYVGNNGNGFLGYSSSGGKAHGNSTLATTISCNVCHNGIASGLVIDTYAMSGTSSDFRCANCHTASTRTKLQSGQIGNTGLHVNGTKDVRFAPITFKTKAQLSNVANALGWTRNGNYKDAASYDSYDLSVATFDPQTKTCLTACHVNQPGITWGAQLKCYSCHANQ